MTVSVILLAGGIGSRMGTEVPKQYLKVHGRTIADYSFSLFMEMDEVREIVVVCEKQFRHEFARENRSKRVSFALPGERRQDSMENGLKEVSPSASLVCVHDAARPCITQEQVRLTLETAQKEGAAVLGVPIKSTVKEIDARGFVTRTLDRRHIWEIQTPQIASSPLLQQGLLLANERELSVTDDMMLIELIGHPVKVVTGSYENIKVTTPEDLDVVRGLLEQRAPEGAM